MTLHSRGETPCEATSGWLRRDLRGYGRIGFSLSCRRRHLMHNQGFSCRLQLQANWSRHLGCPSGFVVGHLNVELRLALSAPDGAGTTRRR